jgi:hypothetical protein
MANDTFDEIYAAHLSYVRRFPRLVAKVLLYRLFQDMPYSENGLLDNSYQLYLVCTYDANDFTREKERLESLAFTYEGETNTPTITDTGFNYHAVVTMFNDQESFEYALIDSEAKRIVYVFAQSMGIDARVVPADFRPQGFQPPSDELAEWGGYNIYRFKIDEGVYTTPGTGHTG